ncbi:MAG: tetratricopeptide repeat protein [Prevotella sp.]|nr:tetratricopeptide repeat protein [Prevotella sp.]
MRKLLISLLLFVTPVLTFAQFRTNRLLDVGRSALYYEDYVLSIQYFNQVIMMKPYLYEPWFLRGVAKFYLDDYVGAENDCSEAIRLNPYISEVYEVRGLSLIKQGRYEDAIKDYDKTIDFSPYNKGLWYNRVLCKIESKDYDAANADLDSMIVMWKTYAKSYSLKAEVCLQQKDTITAGKYLDQSLDVDPYDGDVWAMRALISMSEEKWKDADQQLSKAIHLKPTTPNNYVNRALARYNINNLRGALSDYDKAIELAPNNFLAHYNRGQLRVQVGDDNRAISDFDYVISMEPNNVMAIYNRAILLERTGDIQGAIRDYSVLIDEYPNFWAGLSGRARCYRLLGMTAKAEQDEFRIFKAQNDKHNGVQPRWSKKQKLNVRKKSEIDFNKYNNLVVEDENNIEHEYSTAYRGHVQNRKVDIDFLPMYQLSFSQYDNGMKSYQAFDPDVEEFNHNYNISDKLYVKCNTTPLSEDESQKIFDMIDMLTDSIMASQNKSGNHLLLLRAVANGVVQNYGDAVSDLTKYIQNDSTSSIAYWQRAVYQARMNEYNASQGIDVKLKMASAMSDINKAIILNRKSAYLYYNRGNLHAANKDYPIAVEDYNKSLELDPNLAEAYYNRGIANIELNDIENGVHDLSKAGELGLYNAYSIIKKYSKK